MFYMISLLRKGRV